MSHKKSAPFFVTALGLIATFVLAFGLAHATQPVPVVNTGYAGTMQPAVPVSIPSASPSSAAIALKGYSPVGIYLPSAFTGATISFTASDTLAGTYLVVKSTTSGTTLSYTVTQNTYVALDPVAFYGINYLKIVSASSEAGTRSLKLALKGL